MPISWQCVGLRASRGVAPKVTISKWVNTDVSNVKGPSPVPCAHATLSTRRGAWQPSSSATIVASTFRSI